MLRPAADGGEHFLRVGRREHEHDVVRRLLERLQERVRSCGREHVDLVDDVDLPPSWRREAGAGNEVAHRVDAVVRGGVEFVDVEGVPRRDRSARVADAARLPVDERGAVEGFAEDAGRGGLPGPSRSREEVGVPDASVAHRVAQCERDVVLSAHLGEALRPIAAIERLVGSGAARFGRLAHAQSLRRGCARRERPRRRAQRPGRLRHTERSAESCCLPTLTRFTGPRCAEPGHCARRRCRSTGYRLSLPGGVRERPNRHDWKSCVLQGTVGSNPTASARWVSPCWSVRGPEAASGSTIAQPADAALSAASRFGWQPPAKAAADPATTARR